jgi:hypothetical protein
MSDQPRDLSLARLCLLALTALGSALVAGCERRREEFDAR